MSNELFVTFGAVSCVAVAVSLCLAALTKRDAKLYARAWSICVCVLLLVVTAFTTAAILNYQQGPRTGGSLNPGGPSGYVVENLLVMGSALIAAPSAYVCLLLLFLLPPYRFKAGTRCRISVYGTAFVLAATLTSLLCNAVVASQSDRAIDESKERRMRMFNTQDPAPPR